jgi:putative membrane protein
VDPIVIVVAAAIGLATGLIPGLHVNTIAVIAATSLAINPTIAVALVIIGVVHTVVSILPTTYLGAPGEDTASAALPAHQMLQQGRGPEAIRISVYASVLALVLVVTLLFPVKWLLTEPLDFAPVLATWLPWILLGVLGLLLFQDRRKGSAGLGKAILVMAAAGVIATTSWGWPTSNPWQIQASPLLPLLTGLFAAPSLLHAAARRRPMPTQPPCVPIGTGRNLTAGVLVSAGTAVLPGLTAAVATAIVQAGGASGPRRVIATLSAVNTAHLGFALVMFWLIGATRSGLADAAGPALRVRPWAGTVPIDLHTILVAVLMAVILDAIGTVALEPWFGAACLRFPKGHYGSVR